MKIRESNGTVFNNHSLVQICAQEAILDLYTFIYIKGFTVFITVFF